MTFLKATAVMLSGRVVGAGLGFAISMLAARILSPAEFGAVVAAIAALGLLGRAASLGLGQSAQYWGATEKQGGASYALTILVATLAPAVFLTAALFVASPVITTALLGDEARAHEVFGALMYAAPLILLHFVMSTYLLGRRRIQTYQILTNAPLAVTAAYLAWTLLRGGGIGDVILAYQLQYGLAILLTLALYLADRRKPAPLRDAIGGVGRYAMKSYVVFILAFAAGQIAVLIGAHFTVASELARFAVARVWSEGVMVIYGAIGPLVMSYVGGMKGEESRRFIGPVARLSLLIFLGSGALFAAAAPLAVPLLFGQPYAGSWVLVLIVMPGLAISGSQRVLENYLYGRNKQGLMSLVHVASIITLFAAGAWLIPQYGAAGLAWATTLSYFGSYLLTSLLLYRTEGIALHEHLLPRPSDLRLLVDRVRTIRTR